MQDLTEKLAELERERSRLFQSSIPTIPQVKEIQSQIDESQTTLSGERERAAKAHYQRLPRFVGRENMLQQAFKDQQREADLTR